MNDIPHHCDEIRIAPAGADALPAHRLFERQAALSPEAVAVVCGTESISYRELDERANALAHRLRDEGLRAEELVGVAMRRSIPLMVALLGVWKAGCAYVPLDPAYPRARLGFMLEDAGLRLLLSDTRSRAAFADFDLRMLMADMNAAAAAPPPPEPAGLAYAMYTSGSTGQPKGALVTHAGLANYLSWAARAYGVAAGGSVPVHSSLSFDLTVTSLYLPLLVGAEVELLAEEEGVQGLLAALRARRRSLVKLTPAHLELLNHELQPAEMAAAADVFVIGGERLTAEQIAPWRRHAPTTRLINEYGPTETVVGCCVHEVASDDPQGGAIPIGRPIANMRLYVLDAAMRELPPGEAGELCIGGVGVARGYLNRPELTQQRFVPDGFAAEPAARLYRSGDLGRRRSDGVFEYLGRMDEQVKVRGHRIEPAEIERALLEHPELRSCAALASEDGAGGAMLAAFAVAVPGGATTAEELHAFAAQRLPQWMRPQRIVVVDALPLNANGKVDRKALRAALAAPPDTVSGRAAAEVMTATEALVVQAFRNAFERSDIGLGDGFFDIGGHSLLAVRLMARLRAATGMQLPLRNLYEWPTPAGLAAAIDALAWSCQEAGSAAAALGERTQIML